MFYNCIPEQTKRSKIMKATVKTKSNFYGLNGQTLEVKEIVGTRVTCIYFSKELQLGITIDFSIKEIVSFSN